MEQHERETARREILEGVSEVFLEQLAASEWGRLLVRTQRDEEGALQVTDVDVEDIVGDEAQIERIFGGPGMQDVLPLLARTTEALTLLGETDPDLVEGGTFIRIDSKTFGFLPGLVRTPSASMERLRDSALPIARARQDRLETYLSFAERYDVDLEAGAITFEGGGRKLEGQVVLLGSYSEISCQFYWGYSHEGIPESVQNRCRALVDAVPQRDMWELTTKFFATDLGTSMQLAMLIAQANGWDGVYPSPQDGGIALMLVNGLLPS
jgi:hypothetical protein